MADLKTQPTSADPKDFISQVENDRRRADAFKLLEMMTRLSGSKPVMWGPSIIGFGDYRYKYESGREADWFEVGFSPRKTSLSVYLMAGHKNYPTLMSKLGKYKTGASCLYINKLDDVDLTVLEQLIQISIEHIRSKS